MKFGIFMLIVGLFFAGLGIFLWDLASSAVVIVPGGIFDYKITHDWFSSYEQASLVRAIGIGIAVIGSGLSIGGIVRMIAKR